MKSKKILVILVDRANYGRMKPVMLSLRKKRGINLCVVCAGSMLLERFGCAKKTVVEDGFNVVDDVYLEVEGSLPTTMTKSIGLGIIEFSSVIKKNNPDLVCIIGDRYEALAAAIATTHQNYCLVHLQGGEVTGSIDESTRHAITKLAHYHYPATQRSGRYIAKMGEDRRTIFTLGCPSADVVAKAAKKLPEKVFAAAGVGHKIDFQNPYLLVLFHPVTTDYSNQETQMEELLRAIVKMSMQTVLLWPNIDAGADGVTKSIRKLREKTSSLPLHAYKNFSPEIYIPLLKHAACCIGNSSSFVRETSFLGTPVVLVGSRQDGREWSHSVSRVEPRESDIYRAIMRQIRHGSYDPSNLYGSVGCSNKIAESIIQLKPYLQKKLQYNK